MLIGDFERLIENINSEIRYGSRIKQIQIDKWFDEYQLDFPEKIKVYKELSELSIAIIDMPSENLKAKLFVFFKCLGNESEIDKKHLNEWFAENNIPDSHQNNFQNILIERDIIIKGSAANMSEDKDDYSFLDHFEDDEDLDTILDDDEFTKEVERLESVVDKSFNLEYLDDFHNGEEDGRKRALENLVIANEKLVWKYVDKYKKNSTVGFNKYDMFQVGMLGLITAAERFDLSLGYQFSTYAIWWIRQSITRAIYDYSLAIRIPVHYRELMNKFRSVDNDLWNEFSRPATLEEIAMKMDIDGKKAEEIAFYIYVSSLDSLDRFIGENSDTPLGELIPSEVEPTPEDIIMCKNLQNVVGETMEIYLTDRELKIIELRYGIDSEIEPMTLEDIGKIMGVTRERIRQIEAKALRKLRNPHPSKILRGSFYD